MESNIDGIHQPLSLCRKPDEMCNIYTNQIFVPNQHIHKILLIMRITTMILILAIMQVSAASLAQKISLSEKKVPLASVFLKISQQSGYDFLVTGSMLKDTRPVTIDVKNMELNEVLKLIFKDQPVDYSVEDKVVTVVRKDGISFLDQLLNGIKDITVRGKVVDEKGQGLPGATIKLKGSTSRVAITTGENGNFSIVVPGSDATLLVSYIGYKTKEVTVTGADVDLVIRMETVTGVLEEVSVVSTGYQTMPKERATGSFEKIDNELLNRSTGSSILSRLEGVTTGLLVDRRLNIDGEPRLSDISIRGISTLTASISTPLIILDNFPYAGNVNNINPNDIESVTILKDAAAASIWGARAGNGVIVITTKKGRYESSAQVSFNSNISISKKPDLFKIRQMNTSDFIDVEKMLFTQGFYNEKIDDGFTYLSPVVELMLKARSPGATISQDDADAQIDVLRGYDVRNDLLKYVYQDKVNQQYALNISGGGRQFNYLISGGYDYNRSNTVKNHNNRITLRSDVSYKPIKNFEISAGLFYTQTQNEFQGNNSGLGYSANMLPYTRLTDENGNPAVVGRDISIRFLDSADPRYLDWRYRPLAELNASSNIANNYDLLTNINAKYLISKVFSADLMYQYGRTLSENKYLERQGSYYTRNFINLLTEFNGNEVIRNLPLGGILSQTNGNASTNNIRGQINANKNWGDKHQFNVIAGVEQRENLSRTNSSTVYGYDENLLTHKDVDVLKKFTTPISTSLTIPSGIGFTDLLYRFTSIYSNGAYTYNNRYTVSGSIRKDASNLFGVKTNLRGAPFWSTGVSWDVHKEPFFHSSVFPYLKLRTTYGYQGNTNNNLSALSTIRYDVDINVNLPSAVILNPANYELRWEKVGTLNFGIDFKIRNDVLSGSIDYYTRKSKDVLNLTPLDPLTGFPYFTYNSSELKGRGIDVSLHSNNLKSSIKWNTDLVFSYNTNTVSKYIPVNTSSYISNGLTRAATLIVGKPAYALFSYKWAGLEPLTGDPMGYLNGEKSKNYTDLTKAGLNDLEYNGSATPIYFGGIRNTFSYKNMSLSANITAKLGYYFRRSGINYSDLFKGGVGHADFANRWKKQGDEAFTEVPSMIYPNSDPLRDAFYSNSSALVAKADHIRLQDITFSYSIKKADWYLKNIRFYANISNLGIIWRANKLGIDPEYYRSYPSPRTIALGLNANF